MSDTRWDRRALEAGCWLLGYWKTYPTNSWHISQNTSERHPSSSYGCSGSTPWTRAAAGGSLRPNPASQICPCSHTSLLSAAGTIAPSSCGGLTLASLDSVDCKNRLVVLRLTPEGRRVLPGLPEMLTLQC